MMSVEANDRRTHSYPHHDLVSGRLRLVTTAPYDYVFLYSSKPSRVEIRHSLLGRSTRWYPCPSLAASAEGQALADRRFNRSRYDAARTIDAVSVRLRDQLDLDTLTTELLTVLDQTIEPSRRLRHCGCDRRPHRKPGPGRSLDMRWSIAGTRPRPSVQAPPAHVLWTGACQKFARNCATRNLTPLHNPIP